MTDSIRKVADLRAPVDRVWRALTDIEAFGAWFGVRLEQPFVCGQTTRGRLTTPGYEHLRWESVTVALEPKTLFAFTWHPYAVDPDVDYGAETPTLVSFSLEETASGTRLTVTESGFDPLPQHRRDEALRLNTRGWSLQIANIMAYVGG